MYLNLYLNLVLQKKKKKIGVQLTYSSCMAISFPKFSSVVMLCRFKVSLMISVLGVIKLAKKSPALMAPTA